MAKVPFFVQRHGTRPRTSPTIISGAAAASLFDFFLAIQGSFCPDLGSYDNHIELKYISYRLSE
jgi:hypothetical protein